MTGADARPNEALAEYGGLQELLNAVDGIAYLVGRDGAVLAAGHPSWVRFCAQNGADDLTVASVVGKCLFDMMLGEEVQAASRKLHDAVWTGRRAHITYGYRCDAPAVERHMRMSISQIVVAGAVRAALYQSLILSEISRIPLGIFAPELLTAGLKPFRPDHFVKICSYCSKVAWPPGAKQDVLAWIAPEEYYRRRGPSEVVVSHGICPDCSERVVAAEE
jgi:hypothetical protein